MRELRREERGGMCEEGVRNGVMVAGVWRHGNMICVCVCMRIYE